jgi:uncharacterized protein (DUF697 family)
VVRSIVTPENKRLAFAAATAVCNADGVSNASEKAFLAALRAALQLGPDAETIERAAEAIASTPLNLPVPAAPAAGAGAADLDKVIQDASILNGALELLPETLATMAILPLQMRLVYRIGKAYNYDLGAEHARDFIATLGVGLGAQVLEGFARKLLGGIFGGLGRQVASSGMAFVSTYAIGQAAKRYYAGGRKFEALQMKEIYQSMLADGKTMAVKAQDEIGRRATALRSGSLADVFKST